MELAIPLMALLIIVVFGFVLEPIIRARRDHVEVDTVIIPDLPDFVAMTEDDPAEEDETDVPHPEPTTRSSMTESGPLEGSL